MALVQSFPFFCIVLCMFGGIISSVLNSWLAKRVCITIISLVIVMSTSIFAFTLSTGTDYVYMMGHFSAPWGNEIRVSVLETFMALFFSLIMLFCVVGGMKHTEKDVEPKKINLYYLLVNLLLSSILALVYTNDIFTAYVFVEINTIAACGLIVIRQKGHTIVAGIRYMIMSILGSGLFLIGICFLYSITGHLNMTNIKVEVSILMVLHEYSLPIEVIIGLICAGLAMKSALFPFHFWVPDTYGYSTCATASMLSSLVSKAYIFLLIKFMFRAISFDVIKESNILNLLFFFGVAGMIMGSIGAIREKDLRRMIAYSSVAQIGYIFMGIGMGTTAGMIAAIFHIIVHASTKSLLFISGAGLTQVSGDSKKFNDLTSAGFRHFPAGLAFLVGSLSMVGIPAFAGFMSKILFATAAVDASAWVWIPLIALAISTILNALYFLKTLLRIFTRDPELVKLNRGLPDKSKRYIFSLVMLSVINIFVGLFAQPIIDVIGIGLEMFMV